MDGHITDINLTVLRLPARKIGWENGYTTLRTYPGLSLF